MTINERDVSLLILLAFYSMLIIADLDEPTL